MYQNILVPIDGSEPSGLGLQEAIQLAQTLGARIRLLHVVNKTPWIAAGAMPPVIDDLISHSRSAGEAILRDAMGAARVAGVDAQDQLIEALGDRAGEIIISDARAWPAHLIVCGTHGRRGLKRILMGSDAEYIVRHSPVPILLIRPPG